MEILFDLFFPFLCVYVFACEYEGVCIMFACTLMCLNVNVWIDIRVCVLWVLGVDCTPKYMEPYNKYTI